MTGRQNKIDRPPKNTARGERKSPVAVGSKIYRFRLRHRVRCGGLQKTVTWTPWGIVTKTMPIPMAMPATGASLSSSLLGTHAPACCSSMASPVMRTLATALHEHRVWGLVFRVPGHDTAPGGLTEIT